MALPHVQPYYDTYLASYVEKAQPYVDQAKTHVYNPALTFAKTHGAPRLSQAQKYGQKEWERTVRPRLDLASKHAYKQYDATLAPHVQKVQGVVTPYYTTVKTSAADFYELEFQPAYKRSAPYAKKFYKQAHRFTLDTALPYAQWGTDLTWAFVRRQIWPRIQILYGENVEPQIFRISQRLGRYRDEKKIEAAVESMESSSTQTLTSTVSTTSTSVVSSASPAASSASSIVESVIDKASSVVAPSPSMAAPEDNIAPAEQFTKDLKTWEQQVAKAVSEGAEHLGERVQEICDRQIEHQGKGVGAALIIQLEETVSSAFSSFQTKARTVIAKLPESISDSDISSAEDTINQEVRKAGQSVKNKAQNVREWKQTYDKETTHLIEAAANSTLETIDNIRDLRLQDIGRRWASNGDISHKDWSRYNELKKASSKWRDEVETVAINHAGLAETRKIAVDVEENAMAIAEGAANELSRLKTAALWKLDARDSSDDFNTKYVPAAAMRAKQQVVDAVVGSSSQDPVESATSVAASKAAEYASSISEAVIGSSTGSVESAASKVSEKVVGTEQPVHESVVSVASASVQNAASAVSESVIGTEPGLAEKVATTISEAVVGSETPYTESISSAASSLVKDSPIADKSLGPKAASLISAAQSKRSAASSSAADAVSAGSSSASSVASEVSSSASSVASSAPSVKSIVLDASSSVASAASSVSKSAPSVLSDASSSVVSAASGVSSSAASAVSGVSSSAASPESVASDASSSLSSAASSISKSAPTPQSVVSNISSSVASVASSVSEAAPAPESIVSDASSSITSASSEASAAAPEPESAFSDASSSIVSVVSQASEASPSIETPVTKKVWGGAMAQAVPPPQQIIFDEDIVDEDDTYSQKLASMLSSAGAQASQLTQAVQDALKPAATQGSVESITSLASVQYESAIAAASVALFGTQQGVGESVASAASERYAEAVTA